MEWVERRRRLLLGAIVLFAFALRLVAISKKLSSDDGYTWLVASAPNMDAFLERLAAYENTPPLFYLILWLLPDNHEFWLRIPSMIPSLLAVPVLYAIVRPMIGTRAALLAALGLAVAPTSVELSNYSRGFMLAELGILLAMWGVARRAQGGDRRWWLLYIAGALIALWSEYNSGFVLGILGLMLLAVGRPPRREVLTLGVLPALTLVPWLGQLRRALDQIDVTKWAGVPPDPSLGRLRDIILSLTFGRILPNSFGALADVRLVAILAIVAAALVIFWRMAPRLAGGDAEAETEGADGPRRTIADVRLAYWMFAGTAVVLLAAHWVLARFGVNGVFVSKYLTTLVPLTVVVLAAAIAALPWRQLAPVAAAALVVLGVALGVVRHRDAPRTDDVEQIHALAQAVGAKTILTNASEIVYYLRDMHTVIDRPFDLRPSQEAACVKRCPTPLLIIDQLAYPSTARPGPGPTAKIGGYVVRLHPTPGAPKSLPAAG